MSEHKTKKRGRPPKATQPVQTTDIEGIREELEQFASTDEWNEIKQKILKDFLKAVYNDGALGNRRSLTKDIATLKGLL